MMKEPAGQEAMDGAQAFKAGVEHFSRGDVSQAIRALEGAVAAGHAEAQNLLGLIYLNGMGVPCQHDKACELMRQAANAGSREAAFNLSGMLFSGLVTDPDPDSAVMMLRQAALLDHRAALRVLGLVYASSIAGGDDPRAAHCFRRAAALGDIHAMYFAGCRHSEKGVDEPERRERLYWLSMAARAGLPCAIESLARIPDLPDARELESSAAKRVPGLSSDQSSIASFSRPDLGFLVPRPRQDTVVPVSQQADAVSNLLCDYLINLSFNKLQPSSVIDPVTGQGLRTVLRTSYSMNFMPSMYDMAVGMLCSRMAALVGMPAKNAEPLVVLKYLPGQEYKPHFDYVPDTTQRGQRIATVLLYLNQPEAGGETDFPRLGVRVTPQRAKAIGFYNCDAQGAPDSRTLHAGLPVTQGEKWLATLWFRERPYDWST